MTNTHEHGETKESNENSTEASSTKDNQSFPKSNEKWGYDLYPERKGEKHKTDWLRAFFMLEGRYTFEKIRCEKNVYNCCTTSPLVKLMMGALKGSGCEIDMRRHISCEFCDTSVSGGYDPLMNQENNCSCHHLTSLCYYLWRTNIVVCQNTSKTFGIVQGVLTHEMIHMFDFCRNHLDFKNIDHLACTEIRAANLTHCSFLSAITQGDASFFNIKKAQQECVKNKAVMSVMSVRRITREQAREAVDRTFPKCYPDLEPIGRRLRPRSTDMFKAYRDGPYYGYDI